MIALSEQTNSRRCLEAGEWFWDDFILLHYSYRSVVSTVPNFLPVYTSITDTNPTFQYKQIIT